MLTKQFIITYRNGVMQALDTENEGKCNVGNGFLGVEFNSIEELDAYIKDNNLITIEEAIQTKTAVLDNKIVDTATYVFDSLLFDSPEETEAYIEESKKERR